MEMSVMIPMKNDVVVATAPAIIQIIADNKNTYPMERKTWENVEASTNARGRPN